MKKTTIVLLLLALIAGLFISCSQEVTVDADVHNKINDIDTFCINGKYFSTLQAAVDYFKDSKAMKAPGDNDNVIYLTRNASGPGADIVDIQGLVIDFAGFTYSFTNVTAIQGETGGKFGLSITDGSEVTLKGLEQIDLFDSTADLTMVYIEGSDTILTIEDAPKMVVEPTQYVFWAANGATLTIGSTDATKEASITGKIAATGGTTKESVPTITVKAKTTITGDVEATKAEVTLSGKTVVTGTVSATESKIEANETSKVTGKIEASASKVSVSGAAKIEVDLTAKDKSEVVINTVEAGAGTSVIKTMDKEDTSTVVVAGGTVNVEEVAEGSDNAIEVSDDATVEGGVVEEPITTYVAKINGKSAYATMEEAIEAASTTGHRDEIILLQAITKDIVIPQGRDVIITSKNFDVGSGTHSVEIKVDGSVVVKSESNIYGSIVLESGSVTVLESGNYTIVNYDIKEGAKFTITGGTYNNFDPTAFVPKYCEITGIGPTWTVTRIAKDDAVAEIAGDYYKDLQVAINEAEDGDTVKLLQNINTTQTILINKDITVDGGGKTITIPSSVIWGIGIENGTASSTDYQSAHPLITPELKNVTVDARNSEGAAIYTEGAFLNAILTDVVVYGKGGGITVCGLYDGVNKKLYESFATLNNVTAVTYGNRNEEWKNYAISSQTFGTVIVNKGTFNATETTSYGSRAIGTMSSPSKVIVNDGTVNGKVVAHDSTDYSTYTCYDYNPETRRYEEATNKTTVSIVDGEFSGEISCQHTRDTISITGGTFDHDPSAYVADGYYADDTEIEGKWVVKPASSLFDGGTGIEDDPFIIKDYDTFQNVSKLYNAGYYYYKVKDGVESIDCSNWTPVYLNGSIDGNNVTISSLDRQLFKSVGKAPSNEHYVVKNFTVNAYIKINGYGAALIFMAGNNLELNNITVHGYIEGNNGAASFVCFGPGNLSDSATEAMDWRFVNCISDATIVATGDAATGFVKHPLCYASQQGGKKEAQDCCLITIEDSAFLGILYHTGNSPFKYKYFIVNANDMLVKTVYSQSFIDKYGNPEGTLYTTPTSKTSDGIFFIGNYPGEGTKISGYSSYGTCMDTYLGQHYSLESEPGVLPDKYAVFTVNKADGAVLAKAVLEIAPNDPSGHGSYLGTYMSETIDISSSSGSFTTSDLRYFDITINGTGPEGLSGNTFNVVNPEYGTTHNGAGVRVTQYDDDGNVKTVTYFKFVN